MSRPVLSAGFRLGLLAPALLVLAGCEITTHYYVRNFTGSDLAAVLVLAPPEEHSLSRLALKRGPLSEDLPRGAHESYAALASRVQGGRVLFTVPAHSTVFIAERRGGSRLVFRELSLKGNAASVAVTDKNHEERFKYRDNMVQSVVNAVLDVR